MKKTDLRDGDLIYLANGGVYEYIAKKRDGVYSSGDIKVYSGWLGLENDELYNNNLKAGIDLVDGYEIVKITRKETIYELKQMTLEEIEQELGYKIQIIKEL